MGSRFTQAAGAVVCTAGDAAFFPLLRQMVESLPAAIAGHGFALGVLDLGLSEAQRHWLQGQGATLVEPGWDVDFAWRAAVPGHYRGLSARPHLRRYFPGHATYIWLDADLWVQDPAALELLHATAAAGRLAIVPEMDRGYWTSFKPPRLWGQNQKAFAWAFGWRAGYRHGRMPILNAGVFALAADAPHWEAWAAAHRHALTRRRWLGADARNFSFQISEQTALNHAAWALRERTALLPATANWFCGKGTPAWDAARGLLVEPHPPHQPLGIVHLAGKGMKERVWELPLVEGGRVHTLLTRDAVLKLAQSSP